MAEGSTHRGETRALLHMVRGEGMPQRVHRSPLDAGYRQILGDNVLDGPWSNRLAELRNEQLRLLGPGAHLQVVAQRPARLEVEGNGARLAPLALDVDRAGVLPIDLRRQLDIGDLEASKLGQ